MIGTQNQRKILLESGTNELEVMEFSIGKQHFGVNVAKVRRLLRWDHQNVTRLDFGPPGVLGSLHFMNQQVLLIDLRSVLDIADEIVDQERQLILVCEFNHHVYAFIIDAVNRIHRVSWKSLQPVEGLISHQSPYTTSSLQIEDRVIMILDMEHILSEIVPEQSIIGSTAKMDSVQSNFDRATIHILFAEDSAMIRKITVEQLNKAGFTHITTKNNGKLAYEYLQELQKKSLHERKPLREYLQMVLSDIEMPEMDGLTFCKHFRENLGVKNIPFVVYSSLINDQMATKCKSVGANAWMSKPEIDKIVHIIDQSCVEAAAANS
ncbi:MAG: chemotaxis protein CheV [Verrucomicrobiota bacterium]